MKTIFSVALLLCCLGITLGSTGTTTANVVAGIFSDAACTTQLVHPIYATNGSCIFGGKSLESTYYEFTANITSNTISVHALCTTSTCGTCGVSLNVTAGKCVALQAGVAYLQPFFVVQTNLTLPVYNNGGNTTGADSVKQYCSVNQHANITLDTGVCTSSGNGSYTIVSPATASGATFFSYAVIRNCSDATCTSCTNGYFYTNDTSCINVALTNGTIVSALVGSPANFSSTTTGTTTGGSATTGALTSGHATGNTTATGSTSTTGSASTVFASASLFVGAVIALAFGL